MCYELLIALRIFDKITLSYLVERQSVLGCKGDIHFFLTFLEDKIKVCFFFGRLDLGSDGPYHVQT